MTFNHCHTQPKVKSQEDLQSLDIIQIYSGITCGRVLNGELYTCKLYKLINLFGLQAVS